MRQRSTLLLLLLLPHAAAADGPVFRGTVEHRGRPVEGAAVWLVGWTGGDNGTYRDVARTTTDAQGWFTFPVPAPGASSLRAVVARKEPQGMGWLSVAHRADLSLEPALRVELREGVEARGRLLDTAGQPLRGVRLRQLYLHVPSETNPSYHDEIPLPAGPPFEAVTGDDGAFALGGIPAGMRLQARLDLPDRGDPWLYWDAGAPCAMRLEQPGRLRVRFEGADEPKRLAGMSFFLARQPPPTGSGVELFVGKLVAADATGNLAINRVLPGTYHLTPRSTVESPYGAAQPAPFAVKPGEETEVVVTLKPLARIEGRVVDGKTGAGVAGVWVNVVSPTEQRREEHHGQTRTDKDGRFRAYAPQGKINVQTWRHDGYLPPADDKRPPATVAVGDTHTFPDLTLEPAYPVSGVVRDEAGRPVPHARVLTAHGSTWDAPPVVADAQGRFTLRSLGPRDFTALRARTAAAVTEGGVALDVAKHQDPLTLVLKEAPACRFRGAVVDDAGRPVAGVAVRVAWRYHAVGRNAASSFGEWLETYRTDGQGHFETQALWPGDEYYVQVFAPGHGPSESQRVRGEAGKVHDFVRVVVQRLSGTVAGVVTDADGKPLAGVRVFNEGDGPQPRRAVTGADGRFRLDGLFGGPIHVFARKEGYRFTLVRTKAGEQAAAVRLHKAGTLPPDVPQPDPRPPAHVAAEKQLTRHLLERLWDLPRAATGGYEARLLELMARQDLARARRWLAEERRRNEAARAEGGALSRVVRLAEAEHAAKEDADEAVTLLAPLPPDYAAAVLTRLADRHRGDPAKALRFAEEAVVRARAQELPSRAASLARAGGVVARLGRPDAAKKLLGEAAGLAEKMGTEGAQGSVRGTVARQLGRVDLPRARALIQPFPEVREANRWVAELAVAVAPHDLEQAEGLLKELRADNSLVRDETRVRIALRLAPSRPDEAVRQAERVVDTRYRALALAGVAGSVGATDPARAHSLIDRALDLYLEQPDTIRASSSGHGAHAALVAYLARTARYPDPESVVARVLATRPTRAEGTSAEQVTHELLQTACVLALTDPAEARRLLDQAAPRDKAPPAARPSREWLFAVALADPERARGFVDELLEQARKSRNGVRGTNLVELAMALAAPTEQERFREIGTWIQLLSLRLFNEED